MTSALYAVYGVSGFGREVMPMARWQMIQQGIPADRLVFVDDNPHAEVTNGQRVMRYEDFLSCVATARYAAIAIANSEIREKIASRCANDGVHTWALTASNVAIMDEVELDEGAILSPFVTLTSNIRIGRYFLANLYSYVAHDCLIGDFVTFAPGVKCNGNIVIEDHAYIGAGAVIKQGRTGQPLVIGRGAVVGMGSVVTKDVPAGATVVGNPAKLMLKD